MQPRSSSIIMLLWAIGLSTSSVPGFEGAAVSSFPDRQPRVLVLFSNERLLPANNAVDEAIRTAFSSAYQVPVEFYTEFLDVDRFPGMSEQERTREFFREKYRERPPDVIIAGGGAALDFLIKHRTTLFAGVPIVHCGVSPNRVPAPLPDDLIVGIPHAVDMVATLEIALRLQPDTRKAAILGVSNHGGAAVSNLATKVEFLWLTNQSILEIKEVLRSLPDHTVVFYGTMFRDNAGNTFTPRAALDLIAEASHAPIYGYYSTYLGHGVVGGSIITYQTIGRGAAQIAIRILQGQHPQDAVRGVTQPPTPMFDWRQLQRWNISESRLPPGSEVLFREPNLWEEHKPAILGSLAIILIEGVLIFFLVLNLIKRRRAERLLKQSEESLSLASSSAGAGLWTADLQSQRVWASPQFRKLFHFSPAADLTQDSLFKVIHPSDLDLFRQAISQAATENAEFTQEFRIAWPDGTERWISARGRVATDPATKAPQVSGVVIDTTERRRSREELRRLQAEAWHADRVARTGAITASLAHELNQPLAAILSASQAGLRFMSDDGSDPAEIRDILQNIVQDTKRAGAVVGGLRAMVRRQTSQRERINLAETVQATLDLLHGELVTNQVKLGVRFQPDCYVLADKTQIQQVVLNLIMNSVEAMRCLEAGNRRIEVVSAGDASNTVEVSVSDTGPGVSPEDAVRLFDTFWTTKAQGLGIGLAICRSIIESHRGRIWLSQSKPGRTTFCFSLPLEPAV